MLIGRAVPQVVVLGPVRIVILSALFPLGVRIERDADLPLCVRVQGWSGDPSVTPSALRVSLFVRSSGFRFPPVLDRADPAETTGKDGQDPSDEGEPYAQTDLGRRAIDGIDPGFGDVEHGDIDDERCEGDGRGEPGEQGGETEEGDVVHGIDQPEDDGRRTGDDGYPQGNGVQLVVLETGSSILVRLTDDVQDQDVGEVFPDRRGNLEQVIRAPIQPKDRV